jgi:hypothetical protein
MIDHYYKSTAGQWQSEAVYHFYDWGGKFIYELSADLGPDNSFHLLVLKSRSDIDSDDYWNAWLDSYLFHISNTEGSWQIELIHNYDMAYTYDHYIKCSCRQDIEIDKDGFVHVIFSQQINATDDPSRLFYATNKSGSWKIETALSNDFGARDDAGWFPSLCLDNEGTPYIIFSDIASSHWTYQRLNVGNIRYAVYRNGEWNIKTIYRQPLPHGFKDVTEMFAECLVVSDLTDTIRIIGQELEVTGRGSYTLRLIEFAWVDTVTSNNDDSAVNLPEQFRLYQNNPNPFNSYTTIEFSLPMRSSVDISIYNVTGKKVLDLVNREFSSGVHRVVWDGRSESKQEESTGIYFCRFQAGGHVQTKKMLLLK